METPGELDTAETSQDDETGEEKLEVSEMRLGEVTTWRKALRRQGKSENTTQTFNTNEPPSLQNITRPTKEKKTLNRS